MSRVAVAGLAALATFGIARFAVALLLDVGACRTPTSWWPHWAWVCDAPAQRAARAVEAQDWAGALPLLAAAATFLAVGLTGRRR